VRNHLACYVDDHELRHLKEQAARRKVSLSRYIRECLLGAQPGPYPQTDSRSEHAPVSEALLRETERRIVDQTRTATGEQMHELLCRLGVVVTMLDQFALTMLIHTPEVPEADRKRAATSGERRHRNWRHAVEELLQEMGVAKPGEWNGVSPEPRESQQ
jgi:hypothetical protein